MLRLAEISQPQLAIRNKQAQFDLFLADLHHVVRAERLVVGVHVRFGTGDGRLVQKEASGFLFVVEFVSDLEATVTLNVPYYWILNGNYRVYYIGCYWLNG